jgi:CheY-like chemotaxis protein
MHVLLAEDDDNDALLMKRAFQRANNSGVLRIVRDGEEVIDYLQGKGQFSDRSKFPLPSVLIVDLKMPKKNGFEVLQWIKEHREFRRIPAVVLSSSKQERDIVKAYELHANSYLVKPSAFNELQQVADTIQAYWIQLNRVAIPR